jgi:hypothetical protein
MLKMIGACILSCGIVAAATVGQIDTFQNLTTQGWIAGGGPFGQVPPVPPHVVASGGPAGAGDAYLLVTSSGGNGPGSRLSTLNPLGQWAGNYPASGITGIAMDLKNFGTTDLVIRLLFEDPIPGPPVNEAVSTVGFTLPVGGGWTRAFFPVLASNLTALDGTAAGALSNTTVLRIIHATSAGDATPVAGILGIDNITATPEPATWMLAGLALAGLVSRRLRA